MSEEGLGLFDGQDKEKGALEKLNEIAMEMQEMEESMAFMDEYAQKFYKLAREDEKSFRKMMSVEAKYAKMRQYVILDEDIRIMI